MEYGKVAGLGAVKQGSLQKALAEKQKHVAMALTHAHHRAKHMQGHHLHPKHLKF